MADSVTMELMEKDVGLPLTCHQCDWRKTVKWSLYNYMASILLKFSVAQMIISFITSLRFFFLIIITPIDNATLVLKQQHSYENFERVCHLDAESDCAIGYTCLGIFGPVALSYITLPFSFILHLGIMWRKAEFLLIYFYMLLTCAALTLFPVVLVVVRAIFLQSHCKAAVFAVICCPFIGGILKLVEMHYIMLRNECPACCLCVCHRRDYLREVEFAELLETTDPCYLFKKDLEKLEN